MDRDMESDRAVGHKGGNGIFVVMHVCSCHGGVDARLENSKMWFEITGERILPFKDNASSSKPNNFLLVDLQLSSSKDLQIIDRLYEIEIQKKSEAASTCLFISTNKYCTVARVRRSAPLQVIETRFLFANFCTIHLNRRDAVPSVVRVKVHLKLEIRLLLLYLS